MLHDTSSEVTVKWSDDITTFKCKKDEKLFNAKETKLQMIECSVVNCNNSCREM